MTELNYIRVGDYYIPDFKLSKESRPIGRYGRMHRDYLKEYRPVIFNQLVLSGNLWPYLADINEQAQQRREVLIKQMMASEGVTEELKETNQMKWILRSNNIRSRAEEIVLNEIVCE